jgi:SOS-response transcriptional repressor LexA
VRHAGATDPESGGQFTVKRYREEKAADGAKRIVLEPANPDFEPLVIDASSADDVQVVAEVMRVVSVGDHDLPA